MRFVLLIGAIFCFSNAMMSQSEVDSFTIYRNCSTAELGVETISFKRDKMFYFVDARSYDIDDHRKIGLQKYKMFKNYLSENVSLQNLQRIKKIQDSLDLFPETLNQLYEKSRSDCHRYTIQIYIKSKSYKFKIKNADFWIDYGEEYRLIKRLNEFFDFFYKEHACSSGAYFFYIVKKGESLSSIAEKFSVDVEYLAMYNMAHSEGFYIQNKGREDFDLQEVLVGDASLWVDDILVIPCLPKKGKYEEVIIEGK